MYSFTGALLGGVTPATGTRVFPQVPTMSPATQQMSPTTLPRLNQRWDFISAPCTICRRPEAVQQTQSRSASTRQGPGCRLVSSPSRPNCRSSARGKRVCHLRLARNPHIAHWGVIRRIASINHFSYRAGGLPFHSLFELVQSRSELFPSFQIAN